MFSKSIPIGTETAERKGFRFRRIENGNKKRRAVKQENKNTVKTSNPAVATRRKNRKPGAFEFSGCLKVPDF